MKLFPEYDWKLKVTNKGIIKFYCLGDNVAFNLIHERISPHGIAVTRLLCSSAGQPERFIITITNLNMTLLQPVMDFPQVVSTQLHETFAVCPEMRKIQPLILAYLYSDISRRFLAQFLPNT